MIITITDFGALPAVAIPQTSAIQAAIDHCFTHGGGEVQVPAGRFLTGGLRLRSGVTLHLLKGACLKGTRNPDDYDILLRDRLEPLDASEMTDTLACHSTVVKPLYDFCRKPGSRWHRALITAYRAHHVAVIGEESSMLDGSDCYDPLGEEQYRGPHLVHMFNCEHITLSGYTCLNAGNWANTLFCCRHFTVEYLRILAGHDGVHMHTCEDIHIHHCRIYTGDDCIAGYGNSSMHVHDCVLNTACSAFRLGGTDVLVEDCHAYGPADYVFRGSLTTEEKQAGAVAAKKPNHRYNMLSFFTYYADPTWEIPHQPGRMVFRRCRVSNADRFIHYNYSGNEYWQLERPLRDVHFSDIEATGISMPLTAYGDAQVPITLTMENCSLSFLNSACDFLRANHYDRISLKNVTISGLQDGALVRTYGHPGVMEVEQLTSSLPDNAVVPSTEPFSCQPI